MPNATHNIYTCPMHPEVKQSQPGFCPICGMTLELQLSPQGRSEKETSPEDTSYKNMLYRFWVALVFAACVIFLAMYGESYVVSPILSAWLQLLCAAIVVFGAGGFFFQRAWVALKGGALNMFSLISLGVGVAFFYSAAVVMIPGQLPAYPLYFETAVSITVLVLLGQLLESKARGKTSAAIRLLLERGAKKAHRVQGGHTQDGQEVDVSPEELQVGDSVRVRPGEIIPADGVITKGDGWIDASMLTGESLSTFKEVGDKVAAGTINERGSFLLRVEKAANESLLARIVQMCSTAIATRAPVQKLADTICGYFVPVVVLLSIITFFVWLFLGPAPAFGMALMNAISVVIIACPCALGLAAPLSIVVGMGKGASMGVLIKDAASLERLEKVDTVVFDKTGTLTERDLTCSDVKPYGSMSVQELLQYAASVEQLSEHPIARAVVAKAKRLHVELHQTETFSSQPGKGVLGMVDGHIVHVGKLGYLEEKKVALPEIMPQMYTTLYVGIDGKYAGSLTVESQIRVSAEDAVKTLSRMGIRLNMLSGDTKDTVRNVAEKLGIDTYQAEVLPVGKLQAVQELKGKGYIVAMAGDGINDAPAIAAADVGIAMGTGEDITIETADVTLTAGDLLGIERALLLGREVMTNIRQNLFFAFAYNIAAIPIAAGVLYPFTGLLLNPIIAAVAMTVSSLCVVINALRLRYGPRS